MEKSFIILIALFIACLSYGQNQMIKIDTVSQQGYLFTETSINYFDKKGTRKKIELSIDKPHWNFFIPLSSNRRVDLKTSIEEFNKPINKELYLAMNLTDSESRINSAEFGLNKIYPNAGILIKTNEQYLIDNDDKTIFRIKADKLSKKAYKIYFIDGTWLKVKIPWKWKDLLGIGSYKTQILDPNYKEGYYYYYLIETKIISSNLNLNDTSIKVITQ